MEKRKRTLSYFEIFAYGAGGIVINLAGVGDQLGMYFLTNVALIPSTLVGFLMMFTTVFDAVNDPIIGNLADQNQSRIGKYRPFFIFGGLLTGVVSVLRFTVPSCPLPGKLGYYAVMLCLYSIGFTACSIPWQTMMSVLSPDYHERNVLLSVRSISGNLIGMFVNAVILTSVAALGGSEGGGWWKFMLIAWLLAMPFLFLCQYGMRRVDYENAIPTPPKKPFFRKLGHVLHFKPVFFLCLSILISSLVISLSNSCEMYYYQYVLQDTGVLSITSVWSFPITIACAFSLPFLLKRMDKRQMILIAFAVCLIRPAAILLFGAKLSVFWSVFLIVTARAGTAFLSSSIFAWIPECVDFINLADGVGSAGILTAATTFVMKLGRAGGQSLAGGLLGLAGFVDANSAITERVVSQILRINGLFPIIGLCFTMLPILCFPISREMAGQNRERIARRDREE